MGTWLDLTWQSFLWRVFWETSHISMPLPSYKLWFVLPGFGASQPQIPNCDVSCGKPITNINRYLAGASQPPTQKCDGFCRCRINTNKYLVGASQPPMQKCDGICGISIYSEYSILWYRFQIQNNRTWSFKIISQHLDSMSSPRFPFMKRVSCWSTMFPANSLTMWRRSQIQTQQTSKRSTLCSSSHWADFFRAVWNDLEKYEASYRINYNVLKQCVGEDTNGSEHKHMSMSHPNPWLCWSSPSELSARNPATVPDYIR